MKRTIVMVIAAIFIIAFVSCTKNPGDGDVSESTLPQPTSTEGQTPTPVPMTDEERLKEQFFQAEEAFAWFSGNNAPEMDGRKTTEVRGNIYYRIADERLSNRQDLEEYISKMFDAQTVSKLMDTKVSGGDLYIDFKGDLYIYGGYVSQLAYDVGEYSFENIKIDGDDGSFTLEYSANPDDSPIYNYLLLLDYKAKLIDNQWQFIDFKLPVTEFVSRANQGATPFPPTPTKPNPPAESEKPTESPAPPEPSPSSERIPAKGIISQAGVTGAITQISIANQKGTLTFEAGSPELLELEGLLRSIESTEVPHPFSYEALAQAIDCTIVVTFAGGSQEIVSSAADGSGFSRYLTSLGSQGDRGYIHAVSPALHAAILKYFEDVPAITPPSPSPSPSPSPTESVPPSVPIIKPSPELEVPDAVKPVS